MYWLLAMRFTRRPVLPIHGPLGRVATRDWTPRGAVTLNPERDMVIDAAIVSQNKQTGTA